jgi:hypothetical protein
VNGQRLNLYRIRLKPDNDSLGIDLDQLRCPNFGLLLSHRRPVLCLEVWRDYGAQVSVLVGVS